MKLGLVVNAKSAMPDQDELAALNPAFLRSILYNLDDLDTLLAAGLPLMVTVNNEMAETGWWQTWESAIELIAHRGQGRIFALCVGNEFDLFHSRNPSDVPPEFAAYLVTSASRILRPAGIKVVGTSVAGPDWQGYLQRMSDLCRDDADWFDLHAYGQRPDGFKQPGWGHGDLRPSLIHAHQIAQRPVVMSEYGVKIQDAGNVNEVGSFLTAAVKTAQGLGNTICPAVAWFAWRDDIGTASEQGDAGFGLRTPSGRKRPAWDAFVAAQAIAKPEPAPPPDPEPEPTPEPEPMTKIERFIRDAAKARGIDPTVAVRVANSEGGVTEPARRGTFATGSSWWPFQLHYGGPGYEHLGGVAGMGNGFTALTGWQPGDPAAWRDSVRYALNRAKASGWGAWYGAAAVGIGRWDGIDRNHPWTAEFERWDFEDRDQASSPTVVHVAFNANEPAHAQEESFDCSQESLEWALWAVGRQPSDDWLEDNMIAEGVMTREHGLMDATGKGLAEFLTRHYGEFGYYGNNENIVRFAEVANEIGPYPLLIGGRRWGHWSGVRGFDAAGDVLLLANPAENWMGVGQTMNRQQFDALGPFSMVRILHPDLIPAEAPPAPVKPPAPEPEPAPPAMTIAEIRARLEAIQAEITALLAQLPAA